MGTASRVAARREGRLLNLLLGIEPHFWRNDPSIESWRRPVPLVRVHGIGTF
jgi:hypothetical protein